MSRTFEAKYHGACGDCGDHITPGDTVGYDDTDTVVCADCLRGNHRATQQPIQVCPECHLDHAGKCDEW